MYNCPCQVHTVSPENLFDRVVTSTFLQTKGLAPIFILQKIECSWYTTDLKSSKLSPRTSQTTLHRVTCHHCLVKPVLTNVGMFGVYRKSTCPLLQAGLAVPLTWVLQAALAMPLTRVLQAALAMPLTWVLQAALAMPLTWVLQAALAVPLTWVLQAALAVPLTWVSQCHSHGSCRLVLQCHSHGSCSATRLGLAVPLTLVLQCHSPGSCRLVLQCHSPGSCSTTYLGLAVPLTWVLQCHFLGLAVPLTWVLQAGLGDGLLDLEAEEPVGQVGSRGLQTLQHQLHHLLSGHVVHPPHTPPVCQHTHRQVGTQVDR